MANEAQEISWHYQDDQPHIGIRIQNDDGEEYPIEGEKLVLLDTGWTNGIILPISIYNQLNLQNWEEGGTEIYALADNSDMEVLASWGYLLIPRILKNYSVKFYRPLHEFQDGNEILIGMNIINELKLLLDGPQKMLYLIEE